MHSITEIRIKLGKTTLEKIATVAKPDIMLA